MLSENKNEIISARIFACSPDRVFKAWIDPLLLAQWWGPKGFTNTFHEFDCKTGGMWRFTMHSPDGTDYHNENRFIEIVSPKVIIFEHLEPIHTFKATANFEEQGKNTRLVLSMLFDSASEYEKVKDFIAVANEENFDRLEKVLNNLK
jgi:uncharacterized protein YndB with AHSA1/START domain